jgi:hypothetical protein
MQQVKAGEAGTDDEDVDLACIDKDRLSDWLSSGMRFSS